MPNIEEDLKEDFLQFYENLPSEELDQPIVVLDDESYTWRTARQEIEAGTDKGKKIINEIDNMNILSDEPVDDGEEFINLAKERLRTMPYYLEVSIGHEGEIHTVGKDELEDHLEKRDNIGKEFAKLQAETIRSLGE